MKTKEVKIPMIIGIVLYGIALIIDLIGVFAQKAVFDFMGASGIHLESLFFPFTTVCQIIGQSKVKVELLVDENEDEGLLGEYPNLPELNPLEDTVLSAPQPQAYNVHFLSSLLTPHRSSAVVPLGAWARDGATHPGVRVIPVRSASHSSPCSSSPIEREDFYLDFSCVSSITVGLTIPKKAHPLLKRDASASQASSLMVN